jgi:hypothetical protein
MAKVETEQQPQAQSIQANRRKGFLKELLP